MSNTPTQNQQLLSDINHGPVSKDLLFSNWLLMCLAGNYCGRINAMPPRGMLTQITHRNPSKLDQTRQNGQKSRGYVVLSGVMSRSKELKIPRSLRACRFKSGPGDHCAYRSGADSRRPSIKFFVHPVISNVFMTFDYWA